MSEYILDGYNLLFSASELKGPFENKREDLVSYFQRKFKELKWRGHLVFDGDHIPYEESGRGYESPLEIIYSPRGQSADSYILEKIEFSKRPQNYTLISNDRHLSKEAKALGAYTIENQAFIKLIEKKTKKQPKEKDYHESPKNFERLLREFEKRLRDKP